MPIPPAPLHRRAGVVMAQDHRRKMCEHCAFRKNSREMSLGEQQEFLIWECMHRTFFCHETMYQRNGDKSKWDGDFDPDRKRDGSPATVKDHQICAGFAKLYGDDFGIDTAEIPLENHALAEMIRKP